MLKASIDIGSNSILLLIVNNVKDELEELENESRMTGLGKELDEKQEFCSQSMDETMIVFKEYSKILNRYEFKPEEVVVTATEASRVAKNSRDFFKKIYQKFGFEVKIITPEAEAFFCGLGVAGNLKVDEEEVVIMDIGGASTEILKVKVSPYKLKKTISLPMGSVRANAWDENGGLDDKVSEILKNSSLDEFKSKKIICVAGSMTSIGAMIKGLPAFDSSAVNEEVFSFDTFQKFIGDIIDLDSDILLKQYPFLGKRSQNIITGARIGLRIGECLGAELFQISTYGLRYGTVIEGKIDEQFTSK